MIFGIPISVLAICGGISFYLVVTYSFFTYCWGKVLEEAPSHIREVLCTPIGSFILTFLCLCWPLIMPIAWWEKFKNRNNEEEEDEDE